MRPVLVDFGFFVLPSYGVMLALGVILASIWCIRRAAAAGLSAERMVDLISIVMIAALAGARLCYVLLNWGYYASDPWEALKVWEGGLSFHGGLAAGIPAALLYLRNRMNFLRYSDLLAPGVALGYAVTRIGCFLNGCCYGKSADLPWCVHMHGADRHPTQIYSSLLSLALIPLLLLIDRRKRYDGQVILYYVVLYSLERFLVEIYRAGESAVVLPSGLTQAQLLSLGLIAVALAADCVWRHRAVAAGNPAGAAKV
ncbi:MAG: prolipoprotein diacylglyceryl transferase [bacterium]|nr:prolipoprotein diacylglyceryl transferase [bacterium]